MFSIHTARTRLAVLLVVCLGLLDASPSLAAPDWQYQATAVAACVPATGEAAVQWTFTNTEAHQGMLVTVSNGTDSTTVAVPASETATGEFLRALPLGAGKVKFELRWADGSGYDSVRRSYAAIESCWDKSSIQVGGSCLADGVAQFSITNTGAAMAGPSTWRLYEADTLIEESAFQLLAGATDSIEYGPRWNIPIRFEADQRLGHPGNSAPRLTLTCEKTTAIGLRSFTATSAGNRGGCAWENRWNGLPCVVTDTGLGWVSGACVGGLWFAHIPTRRTFRSGEDVEARGCEGPGEQLYSAPGWPVRITKVLR